LQIVNTADEFSLAAEIKHNNKYINCLDFAPSGSLVASGDIDGAVRIFDSSTKEMKGQVFSNHGRGVRCVKFAPDSASIVSGGEDLHIYLCDVETQQRTMTLVNHANWITSIAFNPQDPKYFVSTSLDNTVKIWNTGQNKEIKTIEFQESMKGVWSAAFSPDGRYVAVAC
jgi:WD40 repeat protein